jgi:hypothetical protein
MSIQHSAMILAPTHRLDAGVVRHIERWGEPSTEMVRIVKPLFVSASVVMCSLSATAGSLEREGSGAGLEPQPKLLERTERREKPIDVFAAPSAIGRWINQRPKSRLEVSVKISR